MTWQDPRYSSYTLDAAEWQRATAAVKERIAKVFGDRPSTAEVGHDSLLHVGNGTPSEPCEVNRDGPAASPAWRRRIEKARREIAEHQAEIRVRELAERITINEIQNDIKEIRRWANSLQKPASGTGSTESTRHGTN